MKELLLIKIWIETLESYNEYIDLMGSEKISPTVKNSITKERKEKWLPILEDIKQKTEKRIK